MPKSKKINKKNKPKTKDSKSKKVSDLEDKDLIEEQDSLLVLATWKFPEFIKHKRSKLWYVSFAIIFLAMLVYAYLSNNLLFAIILVIFVVLYLFSIKNNPITMETAITEDGIFIGSKFIEYEDFRSFYIIYYPPKIKNLYLETKSIRKQRIIIPLENEDPVYIREILLQYLDEDIEKEEIPATEGIERILKL